MPASRELWTVAMLNALPDDGQRYEIIDGERFVMPAPSYRHQRAIVRLLVLLDSYCELRGLSLVCAPFDIPFTDDTLLQPDLLVLPAQPNGEPASDFSSVGRLIVAIEVLSPSTSRRDRVKKRLVYQRERVDEYWIVDTDAKAFERWRPESSQPEVRRETLEWAPVASHPPLIVDVAAYFAKLLRD